MKRFPEKRVVITGAGSGFGRALALVFAEKGWRIGVSDINEPRADETVKLVNAVGGKGDKRVCDVTNPEQINAMAAYYVQKWGGVDIVVNNAGVASAGYMEEIPLDLWKWMLDVDLMSVIYGCRTFIPILAKQGNGHIVNMASSAGLASFAEMSCYNVPKAGVISLSETLRMELASKNIGVTVVAPTFFKTNLMDQFKSPRDRQATMASSFFEKSKITAEDVARQAYRCVEKKKFYAIRQLDGKVIWMMKRWFPETYLRVAAYVYKNGMMDKYLNVGGPDKK
jgi:NAD(P)-dependent dehydrogenase (short-subunit alcohol dehydrogenase family)